MHWCLEQEQVQVQAQGRSKTVRWKEQVWQLARPSARLAGSPVDSGLAR